MSPSQLMLNRLGFLLATDGGSIAPPGGNALLHLSKIAFTPGPGTGLGALMDATFPGYAPIAGGGNPEQQFTDPVTGLITVQIIEPAGGWHFQSTAAPAIPETIFGWYFTNNVVTELYGMALFPSPILVDSAGQGIDVAQVRFQIPISALL